MCYGCEHYGVGKEARLWVNGFKVESPFLISLPLRLASIFVAPCRASPSSSPPRVAEPLRLLPSSRKPKPLRPLRLRFFLQASRSPVCVIVNLVWIWGWSRKTYLKILIPFSDLYFLLRSFKPLDPFLLLLRYYVIHFMQSIVSSGRLTGFQHMKKSIRFETFWLDIFCNTYRCKNGDEN
ncbi:hypothetical protein K1719_046224 [Acacia pycnantha]|nr:hypothetical protein K1719_046224 [Acacia pycnantha]